MAHDTKVVEWRELSNGQLAVKIRCCDDPKTDHWHTMASEVAADGNAMMSSIAEQHNKLKDRHEKHLKAIENLKRMVEESGDRVPNPDGAGSKKD